MGHYQSKCPFDKRPDAGKQNMITAVAPTRRNRKNEIAAVNSDEIDVKDFYGNDINAVYNVSIAFCDSRIKCKKFIKCFSIFDTGTT